MRRSLLRTLVAAAALAVLATAATYAAAWGSALHYDVAFRKSALPSRIPGGVWPREIVLPPEWPDADRVRRAVRINKKVEHYRTQCFLYRGQWITQAEIQRVWGSAEQSRWHLVHRGEFGFPFRSHWIVIASEEDHLRGELGSTRREVARAGALDFRRYGVGDIAGSPPIVPIGLSPVAFGLNVMTYFAGFAVALVALRAWAKRARDGRDVAADSS